MLLLTLRSLTRRRLACLLLLLFLISGTAALQLLGVLLCAQEAALERVYDDFEIRCTVSNASGTRTDGLNIFSYYLGLLQSCEQHDFAAQIKDLRLKISLPLDDMNGTQWKLRGITRLDADYALLPENGATVRFYDGYDESLLQTDRKLCLVPLSLAAELKLGADGARYAVLFVNGAQERFLVIGEYFSGAQNIVYCPFDYMYSRFSEQGELLGAESASFNVRDNRELDAFRKNAYTYFLEPDPNATTPPGVFLGLLIQDAQFTATIQKIDDNIHMLRLLIPTLCTVSVGISFLASYLFMRGRARECAVMRTLGVHRGRVILLLLCEQALLCALGGGSALLIWRLFELGKEPVLGALFAPCYLLGSLGSSLQSANPNVMMLLRTED